MRVSPVDLAAEEQDEAVPMSVRCSTDPFPALSTFSIPISPEEGEADDVPALASYDTRWSSA
jgi:hypothetical protein